MTQFKLPASGCSGSYGVQLGPDCHIQTAAGSRGAGLTGSRSFGFVAGAAGAAGAAAAGAATTGATASGALAAGVGGLCRDAGSLRLGAVAAVGVAAECAATSSLAGPFAVVASFFLKKEDSDACISSRAKGRRAAVRPKGRGAREVCWENAKFTKNA